MGGDTVLEGDDVDFSADTPPPKLEEADEADRLALEDDAASSTAQPSKAPPEPPVYWRHVKPPPKAAIEQQLVQAGPEAPGQERDSSGKITHAKVKAPSAKSNPAYSEK